MKRRGFLAASSAVALAGCMPNTKGEVDKIVVSKSERKMELFKYGQKLRTYNVRLGYSPIGHKRFKGDGRTPEGTYKIWVKNPDSDYHLSLGISYPNELDEEYATSKGKDPGGEIYIHGGPRSDAEGKRRDWTAGCIAVTNEEVEEIFKMVEVGTEIIITP